jgi:hypothetical protein
MRIKPGRSRSRDPEKNKEMIRLVKDKEATPSIRAGTRPFSI